MLEKNAEEMMGGDVPEDDGDYDYKAMKARDNDCLCDPNVDTTGVDMQEGVLNGFFSVSDSTQVRFSKGNLQCSGGTFSFAEHQYDVIGPKTPFWGSERAYKNDHFDLFGWATSGFWSSPSLTSLEDYQYGKGCGDLNGTKNDWGAYNAISNGGKKANLWRTLTGDEWEYLLKRNEGKLKSFADVNGVTCTFHPKLSPI